MDIGGVLVGSGAGGVIATAINALRDRKKLNAESNKTEIDAAAVISETALALVQPLRDQVRELNEQLDRVRTKADSLERRLDECQAASRRKDVELVLWREGRMPPPR
jgi:ubiquinone biosynthesis protein UbiJ